MTDVHTEALVTYAKRRYEDSYAYHSLYQFVRDVTDVPHWAWSDLPWSDDWRQGWETSSENRLTEAKEIRDTMARTGGTLVRVAADYLDTDLEIELTFTRIDPDTGEHLPLLGNEDTTVYLDHYQRGVDEVTAAPGGLPPEPDFPAAERRPATPHQDRMTMGPRYADGPPSGVPYPPNHERLQPLLEEERPEGWGTWMAEGSAGFTFSVQEHDALQDFVEQFGPDLMVIEKDAVAIDPSAALPWTEMVEPAWLSCPTIIETRAKLMESVANTYDEMHDSLSTDTDWLGLSWGGDAAEAYVVHARGLLTYIGRIREKAELLASEGTQAAKVLKELRLAYAEVGMNHIDRMMKAHEEYIATTTSQIGNLATCPSPQSAAQALIEEVGRYYSDLATARRPKLDEARDVLIPERAALGGPDFGPDHDVAVRPPGLGGYDRWNDGTSWRPSASDDS